ncbi:MAG TPA: non-ribosomal peptide synthetase [Pirellulales bacterium]
MTVGSPASVPAQIAHHAIATPTGVAVADDRGELSFAELERRANQLACLLREAGAMPDRCVGVFCDRSVDFVVAALAVLKSGAAYLPLDSHTPADRARFMLDDAGAEVVLTHREKCRDWPAGPCRIIELERVAAAPTPPLEFQPAPDSLAYVVYTSGSTGRPKGVEITHANLLNLIDWHQTAFGVSSAERASQVAGLGFDAAAWEIWPHLAAGASVHIADELTRRSPQALRDWLVAERITIAFIPTVLAEQLLHADWPATTSLKTLLTGADVLHRRPAADLPFTVVNNYGPSECTVVATSGIVEPSADAAGPPSIGRAIRNAQVLILDENLCGVERGEAGELCIAGALVGRGYRNLPELTAQRFVTVQTESGESLRVYRTGDRARWLPNRELAFLGRLDEQLKIRGYRIEPGEIVAWLDRYPGIEASALVALVGGAGPVLVAYLVVADNVQLMAADVRDFLAARLPDYMLPAQFVQLAALPLTPNGKVDKAALPAPSAENQLPTSQAPPSAAADPEDNVLAKVAALVASLLNDASVSRDDNFFLLGGHSMLAAQLVTRVRDLFGVDVGLRQLFTSPTIAGLSAEISRLQGSTHD